MSKAAPAQERVGDATSNWIASFTPGLWKHEVDVAPSEPKLGRKESLNEAGASAC